MIQQECIQLLTARLNMSLNQLRDMESRMPMKSQKDYSLYFKIITSFTVKSSN